MMHLLKFVAIGMILLAAGCHRGPSRLSKPPKVDKSSYESMAPQYDVRDTKQTKRRIAIREHLSLAGARLGSGDIAAAEHNARQALKLDSSSADAYTFLAVIEEHRDNPKQAGVYYMRAVELAPDKGAGLNNYGAWLCANGFAAESLLWFDRALADERYDSPASALANAGGCALKSGQKERAQRDLRRALELDPSNAYALESMAQSEYGLGRYFEARAFAERRLAAAPATASVLQLAAWIEEKLGDKAAAARYAQRLSKEFPNDLNANSGTVVP